MIHYAIGELCSIQPAASCDNCQTLLMHPWFGLGLADPGRAWLQAEPVQFRSAPGNSPSSGTRRLPRASCSHGHGRSEECKPTTLSYFKLLLMSHLLISSWPKWVIWPSPKLWAKEMNFTHSCKMKEVNTCWAMM